MGKGLKHDSEKLHYKYNDLMNWRILDSIQEYLTLGLQCLNMLSDDEDEQVVQSLAQKGAFSAFSLLNISKHIFCKLMSPLELTRCSVPWRPQKQHKLNRKRRTQI